jgi:hypothetical protein
VPGVRRTAYFVPRLQAGVEQHQCAAQIPCRRLTRRSVIDITQSVADGQKGRNRHTDHDETALADDRTCGMPPLRLKGPGDRPLPARHDRADWLNASRWNAP